MSRGRLPSSESGRLFRWKILRNRALTAASGGRSPCCSWFRLSSARFHSNRRLHRHHSPVAMKGRLVAFLCKWIPNTPASTESTFPFLCSGVSAPISCSWGWRRAREREFGSRSGLSCGCPNIQWLHRWEGCLFNGTVTFVQILRKVLFQRVDYINFIDHKVVHRYILDHHCVILGRSGFGVAGRVDFPLALPDKLEKADDNGNGDQVEDLLEVHERRVVALVGEAELCH